MQGLTAAGGKANEASVAEVGGTDSDGSRVRRICCRDPVCLESPPSSFNPSTLSSPNPNSNSNTTRNTLSPSANFNASAWRAPHSAGSVGDGCVRGIRAAFLYEFRREDYALPSPSDESHMHLLLALAEGPPLILPRLHPSAVQTAQQNSIPDGSGSRGLFLPLAQSHFHFHHAIWGVANTEEVASNSTSTAQALQEARGAVGVGVGGMWRGVQRSGAAEGVGGLSTPSLWAGGREPVSVRCRGARPALLSLPLFLLPFFSRPESKSTGRGVVESFVGRVAWRGLIFIHGNVATRAEARLHSLTHSSPSANQRVDSSWRVTVCTGACMMRGWARCCGVHSERVSTAEGEGPSIFQPVSRVPEPNVDTTARNPVGPHADGGPYAHIVWRGGCAGWACGEEPRAGALFEAIALVAELWSADTEAEQGLSALFKGLTKPNEEVETCVRQPVGQIMRAAGDGHAEVSPFGGEDAEVGRGRSRHGSHWKGHYFTQYWIISFTSTVTCDTLNQFDISARGVG
ncbi:hypothetical protein B0H16DRAFT_1450025 [Mycena metata]|uniref:Uncharacterized protein n=1 Tax=Mycena metata TaxID=1033252 RepID=A0AAD7K026_9AGAR|nr:hypothetical protein B0H16DRAFT_1450025 [Mycena metata]